MDKNKIEITGDMDLGIYSPMELAEEQQLNEISNRLLSNYMEKAKSQGRERQYDVAQKHAVDTINQKYQFKVREISWPDRAYFMFSIDFKQGHGFIISVYYVDTLDTRNNYVVYLTPERPLYEIDGSYIGADTPVGYTIKNMRAGERMKFKQLCQAANELNGNSEETNESESSIRNMIREGLAELAGKQFTHQLGPDGDVVYGKNEQGFFVYTKNNLGIKYFDTVEEAEEYARKLYKAIRLRKNAERQEFDRQMSLDETAQKHLVDVMKRYTEGNATAEEANKAIMDLANSGNGKKKTVNESYAKDGNYTHFAVDKNTNKIVNGWDYHGYDPEELRMYKKDYFIQDLIDYELDPKQYTILTLRGCKARGINPFDDSQWTNGIELNEKSGEGTDPYYGEKHDMENKKIENLGNMTWTNFKK